MQRRCRVGAGCPHRHEMLRTEEEIEKKLVHFDSGIHLGVSFMSLADKSHALSLLSRYESRLHRIRDRAFKRLLDIRKSAAETPTPPTPPVVGQASSPVISACRRNQKSPIEPTAARFLRRLRAHQRLQRRPNTPRRAQHAL